MNELLSRTAGTYLGIIVGSFITSVVGTTLCVKAAQQVPKKKD